MFYIDEGRLRECRSVIQMMGNDFVWVAKIKCRRNSERQRIGQKILWVNTDDFIIIIALKSV